MQGAIDIDDLGQLAAAELVEQFRNPGYRLAGAGGTWGPEHTAAHGTL